MQYPQKGTVTRALRRDAGIIAVDHTRIGYHVRGGGDHPPSIFADLQNHNLNTRIDTQAAADLADHLTAHGWTVTHDETRVVVRSVPTAAEVRRHLAGKGQANV